MEDKWNKPPSIPPNFVTILQLQERWIKEQEQKQKQNKEQQPEPEPEPKPQEQGGIEDAVEEYESTDTKLEYEGFKKNKKRNLRKRQREKKREARALAATGEEEDENDVARDEAHATERKEASVVSRNGGRLRKMSTGGGRGREKEGPEGAASLILSQITAKKREAWKSKSNWRKGEWKKVNEEKVEEEVAGGEAHAPKASGEKEEKAKSENADVADQTVEIEGKLKDVSINAGRERGNNKPVGTNKGEQNRGGHRSGEKEERAKSGNAVMVDQTVEIDGKLKDMPINGGRGRENGTPARPNNARHYRGGRRRFENERCAGMVWVKKGDASSGGNAGEVQSSGGSINESA